MHVSPPTAVIGRHNKRFIYSEAIFKKNSLLLIHVEVELSVTLIEIALFDLFGVVFLKQQSILNKVMCAGEKMSGYYARFSRSLSMSFCN